MPLDRRLHAYRPDLAAAHLRGRVEAACYVAGVERRVTVGTAALRRAPSPDAPMDTQLLFGEAFTVYEARDGWAWGQSGADGYVGYVAAALLGPPVAAPTHRVAVPASFLYPRPDIKASPRDILPMNAKVAVAAEEGRFAELATGGFVWGGHLGAQDRVADQDRAVDFVAVAEQFLHAPYLWGGKTAAGIDCSGLVQMALGAVGLAAPRDSDLQEAALGVPLSAPFGLAALCRGDLLFWKGHVGIICDAARLLHANAHHMQVAMEPVGQALARIARAGGRLRMVRRLSAG
jgi:cell wall-associated NlpC family hydrolase